MQSLGQAAAGKPHVRGFDTDTKLSFTTASHLRQQGYTFCLRYLPITPEQRGSTNHLTYEETKDILNANLALMPVQHVRLPGWRPTREMGAQDGHLARIMAFQAGIPAKVNVWLDLEGIAQEVHKATVTAYCNAWYQAVAKWGYIPGLYVGANCILDGSSLYYELQMQHYWKSASAVPTPVRRGYQMKQTTVNRTVCGVRIDEDILYADAFGNHVQWLAPRPSPY